MKHEYDSPDSPDSPASKLVMPESDSNSETSDKAATMKEAMAKYKELHDVFAKHLDSDEAACEAALAGVNEEYDTSLTLDDVKGLESSDEGSETDETDSADTADEGEDGKDVQDVQAELQALHQHHMDEHGMKDEEAQKGAVHSWNMANSDHHPLVHAKVKHLFKSNDTSKA